MIQSNLNIDEEALVQSYFGGGALGRFLKRAINDGVEQVTKKASDAVRAFKLREGLTDFINKYATGIIPISIGYYASENDK